MKGTFFQRPLEFKLAIEGETWQQGEPFVGRLTVKNHGATEAALDGVKVFLGYGTLRKVHNKAPDAFDLLSTAALEPGRRLAPQGEDSLDWRFETDRNCPITDSTDSLFVLYGQGDATEKLGHLQLSVVPVEVIRDFVKRVTLDFRFVFKSQKSSKGWVEVKMAPPDAKHFAVVEQLVLQFRFNGDKLEVRYVFSLSKIDASAGMAMKKTKKTYEQTLEPQAYCLATGRSNQERIEAAIRDVMDQLSAGALL